MKGQTAGRERTGPGSCGNAFPQLGRSGLEKWKTKGRFPTFPEGVKHFV